MTDTVQFTRIQQNLEHSFSNLHTNQLIRLKSVYIFTHCTLISCMAVAKYVSNSLISAAWVQLPDVEFLMTRSSISSGSVN